MVQLLAIFLLFCAVSALAMWRPARTDPREFVVRFEAEPEAPPFVGSGPVYLAALAFAVLVALVFCDP